MEHTTQKDLINDVQELPYDRNSLTLHGFGLDEFGEGPFGLGDITLGNSYTYGID